MKVFHSNEEVDFKESVVALGNFDGLHIAHMKIIQNGISYARENSMASGVLLFHHHSTEVTENRKMSLITPNEYKLELLEEMGVDFVYIARFDKEFMRKTPEEFVEFLCRHLRIRAVSVGYDYKFGYKASGDANRLYEIGKKLKFEVLVSDAICLDGKIVASTLIRQLLEEGDVENAAKFLGRNFFIRGVVSSGLQNGRRMGLPTANIDYNPRLFLPAEGVYAAVTYVGGKSCKSVVNIGKNPTFGGKKVTVESHIIDFEDNIYGKNIRVDFIKRIRGEIKFSSLEELKKQICRDIESAKEIKF
ncbi:MAG: bifunctional riboflavin kinase/FAD synthetase [Clostridia bacterium]|nr:bifunctional riboflavin kinase/FAD synthetase [Clostridia bacterium]